MKLENGKKITDLVCGNAVCLLAEKILLPCSIHYYYIYMCVP